MSMRRRFQRAEEAPTMSRIWAEVFLKGDSWFVSVNRDGREFLLLGPFGTEAEAEASIGKLRAHVQSRCKHEKRDALGACVECGFSPATTEPTE